MITKVINSLRYFFLYTLYSLFNPLKSLTVGSPQCLVFLKNKLCYNSLLSTYVWSQYSFLQPLLAGSKLTSSVIFCYSDSLFCFQKKDSFMCEFNHRPFTLFMLNFLNHIKSAEKTKLKSCIWTVSLSSTDSPILSSFRLEEPVLPILTNNRINCFLAMLTP